MCLDMANKYMDKLAVYADQMANKTVTDEQIAKILDEMFPATEDMSEREKRNATKAREVYSLSYSKVRCVYVAAWTLQIRA